jgi:hypothetical protein
MASQERAARHSEPDDDVPPLPSERPVPRVPADEVPELTEDELPDLPADEIPVLPEARVPEVEADQPEE